jgi:cytochrome P450
MLTGSSCQPRWPKFLLDVLKQTAMLNQFRRFGISLKVFAPFMSQEMINQRESFFEIANGSVKARLAKEDEESESYTTEKKRPDIVGMMLREMKNSERLTVSLLYNFLQADTPTDGLQEREIVANSVLIVGGGAETTSTCLSGTFYHLCKTPRVMTKLKTEIRSTFARSEDITLQAVGKMDYLKATIDEGIAYRALTCPGDMLTTNVFAALRIFAVAS